MIDGLVSGRTYGVDISLKNRPYALLEAREIGSNIYLDFPHDLLIFDISNTEIQSVYVKVHMPTA